MMWIKGKARVALSLMASTLSYVTGPHFLPLRCCIDELSVSEYECLASSVAEPTGYASSATCFFLPAPRVRDLEKAALSYCDIGAAEVLSDYFGFSCGDCELADVWRYRAAQLGDFHAAYNLHLNDVAYDKTRIFSESVVAKASKFNLSELTMSYIRHQASDSRTNGVSVYDALHYAVPLLDETPPSLLLGNISLKEDRFDMLRDLTLDYVACVKEQGRKSIEEIIVFPSKPSRVAGRWEKSQDGIACQLAVWEAIRLSRSWLIVALAKRPEDTTEKEYSKCVAIVLENLFVRLNLPQSISVMFAGNTSFARQMQKNLAASFNVKDAPPCLLRGENSVTVQIKSMAGDADDSIQGNRND